MRRRDSTWWLGAGCLALVLAGAGVSLYLTIVHYSTRVTLACPNTGVVNCEKVTTSSYARLFGAPVALLGLAYFILLVPLHLPAVWRSPLVAVRRVRLLFAAGGVAMVVWLVYAELFRLDAICLWCTVVHGVVLALFVATGIGTAATIPLERSEALVDG